MTDLNVVLGELPKLLVQQAYDKLKSGDNLTASEMKVCLDICKAYSPENLGDKPNEVMIDLPFDSSEGELNTESESH